MLTADQVTAIVPDAASLKAGRGLATPRKWQLLGGDTEALWGLAMGSGKSPYQTRVALGDLATKCSCPSRKFPCKHAIALMLIACGEPASLAETARPDWLTEWLDARAERKEKSAVRKVAKAGKPTDEAAAAKRREKKAARVGEGVELLRQTLLDLARDGLASPAARDGATWDNLQRRMVDCQAPGLAGALRMVADEILPHPDVETRLAYEAARLFLLCESYRRREQLDETLRAEVETSVGDGPRAEEMMALPPVEDACFVAGRQVFERERLVTSLSWVLGRNCRRWAKVLRFAHLPATIAEPWPVGTTVEVGLCFHPGAGPSRAVSRGDGVAAVGPLPEPSDAGFDALIERYAGALAKNPFLRSLPFLVALLPDRTGFLADRLGRVLPWQAGNDETLRVEAIAGGAPTLVCGEWDGFAIRLLAVADGQRWATLNPRNG